MSELYYVEGSQPFICWDRKTYINFEDQIRAMYKSKTLYVGNLAFFTTELQIENVFSSVGPVKRVIMGLNSVTKTPCGFCFVEYYTHENAAAALKYISGTVCDGNIIRCDLDAGFKQGRQYGRGSSGGQARDDRRQSYEETVNVIRQPFRKPSSGKKDRKSNNNENDISNKKRDSHNKDDVNPVLWLAGALPSGRAPSSLPNLLNSSPMAPQAPANDSIEEVEDGGGKRRRM